MPKITVLTGMLIALLSTWTLAPVAAGDKTALGRTKITVRQVEKKRLADVRYTIHTPSYNLTNVAQ